MRQSLNNKIEENEAAVTTKEVPQETISTEPITTTTTFTSTYIYKNKPI